MNAQPKPDKIYSQKKAGDTVAAKLNIPVVYLTQLIGLSLGISDEKLGLNLNMSPVEALEKGED